MSLKKKVNHQCYTEQEVKVNYVLSTMLAILVIGSDLCKHEEQLTPWMHVRSDQ